VITAKVEHPRLQKGGDGDCRTHEHTNRTRERLDLLASRFAQLTPIAKVFAIVCKQIVAALAQPRASASDDVLCAEAVRGAASVNGAISNKVLQGNLLDTALLIANAPSVMNDAPIA
jgi:hypothetical protein